MSRARISVLTVTLLAALVTATAVSTAGGQQASQSSIASSAAPAPAPAGTRTLVPDTGTAAGKASLPGSGHSVKFVLPAGQWYLVGVDFLAARYGQGATAAQWQLSVCDAGNRTVASILEPYGAIEIGDAKWYRVSVPALALPQGEPEKAAVVYLNLAFDSNKTRGVEVSYDGVKKANASFVGMPDAKLQKTAQAWDWMARAIITGDPAKSRGGLGTWIGPLVELKYDGGSWDGVWSKQGPCPAVRFSDVPAGSMIEGFSVYAAQPPSGDPTRRKADYWITGESGQMLASGSMPYTSFPIDLAWVDVALKTKIPAPDVFYFIMDGRPDGRGGIQFAYDEIPQKSKHATFADEKHKCANVGEKFEWMIRAYVRKPAPVFDTAPDAASVKEGTATAR